MSSPTRSESPGSSVRSRAVPGDYPADDILSSSAPPTDDTPTIITRGMLPPMTVSLDDPGSSVRGRHLAHYELLEPIGVGGMAAVIRARDTQLDRLVALKILPPEMAIDPENILRFHQEARSAAKLDHENIARVFFCGEDQRLHFIAFEFVEGDNLRTMLERRGRLPVGEALPYILQIAAGLAHADQRGVVHRDIKPSNIIITPTGRAKLVDMGLARCLEPRTDKDLTHSGVTLGTFDYISPEQALEPRDADVRSDIYSLGCTFYHLLTGRAPVPEGTAMKKLHHHQNILPTDPREYVPDLPIEIVKILDRMIAKNPGDRFQSCEQLVHQLYVAAQKLGSSTEMPDGILTVEASLPNPPTGRPLLWAALAAVAVVILVLVLDQSPTGPPAPGLQGSSRQEPVEADANTKSSGAPVKAPADPRPVRSGDSSLVVAKYTAAPYSTVKDLLKFLDQNRKADRIELLLAGDLDLSGPEMGDIRGLLLTARQEVIIRPRDGEDRVTLHFKYDGGPVGKSSLVALRILAKTSRIEGIRFLLNATASPGLEMCALLLGEGKHQISRCEFIQAEPTRRVASIVADGGRNGANVTVSDCAFLGFGKLDRTMATGSTWPLSQGRSGGQDAIVRRGMGEMRVENCFFGPHASIFRIEKTHADEIAALTVQHCSVLLPARRSAVFDVEEAAAARLELSGSLICRLPGEGDGEAVLLRQADQERPDSVVFVGQDNGYSDLDAFWVVDDWRKAGWTDFRFHRLGVNGCRDDNSRIVRGWPWALAASDLIAKLEELRPDVAATLNLHVSALRKLGRSATEVIGTSTILGKSWLEKPLPGIEPSKESGPRILLVEENGDDKVNGVFGSLNEAVQAARSGDTILIRHQGEFRVDPVQVYNKKGLNELTLRPARQFRPILTLDEGTSESDPALFRVHYCKLLLDRLEFLLQPGNPQIKAQTVVKLVGDGECILRDCVVTLQKAGKTTLALATLAKPGEVMRPDMPTLRSRDLGPRLALERCFVRGDGDLIWSEVTRPFALEIKDSLMTLSGALLNIDAIPEDKSPPPAQKVLVDLTRTTTYLGTSVVHVKASKEVAGMVPIQWKATACLLVPASAKQALIHLEAPEGKEAALQERFTWTGSQNNYGEYAYKFTPEASDTMPTGMEKWKMPGEEGRFGVKPMNWPVGTRFAEMKPAPFAWPEEVGASPAKLPQPSAR